MSDEKKPNVQISVGGSVDGQISVGDKNKLAQQTSPDVHLSHNDPDPVRIKLRHVLTEFFSLVELQALCFDLNVDFERLPGTGKDEKVMALLGHVARNGRLADLLAVCRARRPHAFADDE